MAGAPATDHEGSEVRADTGHDGQSLTGSDSGADSGSGSGSDFAADSGSAALGCGIIGTPDADHEGADGAGDDHDGRSGSGSSAADTGGSEGSEVAAPDHKGFSASPAAVGRGTDGTDDADHERSADCEVPSRGSGGSQSAPLPAAPLPGAEAESGEPEGPDELEEPPESGESPDSSSAAGDSSRMYQAESRGPRLNSPVSSTSDWSSTGPAPPARLSSRSLLTMPPGLLNSIAPRRMFPGTPWPIPPPPSDQD
jgi:hypothetical protein